MLNLKYLLDLVIENFIEMNLFVGFNLFFVFIFFFIFLFFVFSKSFEIFFSYLNYCNSKIIFYNKVSLKASIYELTNLIFICPKTVICAMIFVSIAIDPTDPTAHLTQHTNGDIDQYIYLLREQIISLNYYELKFEQGFSDLRQLHISHQLRMNPVHAALFLSLILYFAQNGVFIKPV